MPKSNPGKAEVLNFTSQFTRQPSFGDSQGGGDELVNRSYRDRAADDLGHRDVTRNLFQEL